MADLALDPVALEEEALTPVAGRRRRLGVAFWLAVGWIALVAALAILANVLPLPPPNKVFYGPPFSPPSWHYLLGTDELGRDLLSRVIFGARVSLLVGFASIAFGMALGVPLGLVAGYYGKMWDGVISTGANVMLAFPTLIFALAVVAFLGPSLGVDIVVIGVLSVAPFVRLVRASTITYARRDFVLAARMMGFSNRRILWREVMPNVLPSAISFAMVGIAVAIVLEGALSFLGLSVRPPYPSWGNMIAEGTQYLARDAWLVICPSLALFFTVLALNVAGDKARAAFDVKESSL
ncbi:MAG TPA: ABC transporter permease [Acidimicrobiales bacterium]|nr:ABC transporter permease [Acidimicrobiales bacterium]